MEIRKVLCLAICAMLLFFASCERMEMVITLPEIEPMTFEIPGEMRTFYEAFHKKGNKESTYEEFFSEQVRIPRPPFEMETRETDSEKLIWVKTFLGKFKEADELIEGYLGQEKRSVHALSFAGNYYLERNRIPKGIALLLERAQKGEEPEYWLRIIEIAKQQSMDDKKYAYLDGLIADFPDSSTFYRMKIAELRVDQRTKAQRTALEEYYEKFPQEKRYYLKEMWSLYASLDQQGKAIALYEKELDPLNDSGATGDFFSLLAGERMLREYRKQWKQKRDKKSKLLHFLSSLDRGSWEEAEEAIAGFERSYPGEIYTIGRLYKRLGYPRNAYDYYVRAIAKDGETEQLLFEVFSLLTGSYTGSVCYHTKPSTDFIFSFDTDPGIAGGLLSLYYNTLNYETRESDFANVKAQLVNVSFMFDLFSYIIERYPETDHRDSLYVLMMWQLNRFRLYDHTVKLGGEYRKKEGKTVAAPVYEALAEAYYGLNNEDEGNKTYRTLLSILTEEKKLDEYHAVFERFISKLIMQENYGECTKLYWEEIKKHPEDRELYEQFLSLIYNYNLYDEELKVYRYAIKHFNEKTWYHKIARWYIRHKSESAFRSQTKKIREIFNDHELESYLREFVHFDSRKSFHDPGNRFYLAMYTYGMERFPDNAAFAKGLARFYRIDDKRYEKELVKLYKKYFFHDAEFRIQLLRYLSAKNILKDHVNQAEKKNGVLYTLFLASAYQHLSFDEQAEKPLQHLTVLYPDRMEFAERLANLYRSIDYSYYHEERALTEKGIGVFLREICLFPTIDTLYVQLGEMLVEANRYERAKEEWIKRIALHPGLKAGYLNVATILWDYYDFEDASTIIKQGRAVFRNDTMLSKEMAVIYEELNDYENAIKEYINASLSGEYYYYEIDEAISRLQYLSEAHGLGGLIRESFMSAIGTSEEPDRVVRVYADYLERLGLYEEKLEMYAEVLSHLEDPYTVREMLSELEVTDRSKLIIDYAKKLVEITDEIDDYLLLAATYENQKNLNRAKDVYRDLLKLYDDEKNEKRSILRSYSEFLWRHKEHAQSLEMLFRAQEISKGYTREGILSDLAYRALSVDDFKRARKAFDLLLEEDPYNVYYFNLVGDMYQKLGDAGRLEKAYLERIALVGKAPLSYVSKQSATRTLYLGLARRLKELKKESRAQDFYIEAINRNPQEVSILDEVYTFSKQHRLVDRLIQYYEKTAAKSFKDYRWQMVLVRFYMREGNLDAAIEQLRNAASNQPQMAHLHEQLADVLTIQEAYDEAIGEYEKAYILTKGKSGITRKIGLIYLRRGEKQKMFEKFDELIRSRGKGAGKYFEVAEICIAYGLDDEAFRYARQGKEELEANPYKDYLSDGMLATLSEAYLKKGRVEQLMRFLANQYTRYQNETKKQESYFRSEAYTRSSRIRYFISSKLGAIWNDFSSSADREFLSERFSGFSDFAYHSDIVRAYTQFAAQAEVPRVMERALLEKFEADKLKSQYPSMYEITNFYESRGAFSKLYDFLEQESREYARLALLARIVAPDEELKWLRKCYDETIYTYERYGSTFSGFSPLIERYLDLLINKGMDHELGNILSRGASCNGQVLNYFFTRGDGKRAFDIIDDGFSNKSDIWRKAKKAYISFKLNYRKEDGVRYFEEILDIRPIGEKLETEPGNVLFDRDFYVNSFFYGAHDSSYLFAGVEAAPRSSRSYHHFGAYLAEEGNHRSAKAYLEKALELSPTDELYIALARTYLKLRNKEKAMEILKHLDGEDFYTKERYINALIEVGFRKEAEGILAEYLRKHIDTMEYSSTRQALVITKKLMSKRAEFLKELSQKVMNNENFYSALLAEERVDDVGFYVKRYLMLVERGRVRKDFYRRGSYVDRFISEGLFSEALDLVEDTEEGVARDSLPDWIAPKKAEAYIMMERNREGVEVLEAYVRGKEYIPNSNEIQRVLDLAGNDGLELKTYLYTFLIEKGWNSTANYLGLQETYLMQGKMDAALETAKELALRSNYAYRDLFEIARLFFKHRQFDRSGNFLEKAMGANPGFVEARLVKAELIIEQGNVQDGCELLLSIIREKNTKEIKEEAFQIVEQLGNRALPHVDRCLQEGGCEELYIAKARLLKGLKRNEEGVETLKRCLTDFPFASSDVYRLMAELTDGSESVKHLYDALYLCADSKQRALDLIGKLIALGRDEEVAMLISRSDIDPSNFMGWYDRESAKKQYLSKARYLITDMKGDITRTEQEEVLFSILSQIAEFYERREDYRAAEFIVEALFSLRKDDTLMEKIVGLGMKAEEKEKESIFIIKEDIANGEFF
jgi:tetratricopeptide (TPR) repeat protein